MITVKSFTVAGCGVVLKDALSASRIKRDLHSGKKNNAHGICGAQIFSRHTGSSECHPVSRPGRSIR